MTDYNKPENKGQESGKYMSSVKVGSKGQIVIPKEAREMFGIQPGDTLLLLADANRGIAVQRLDYFDKIADEIFLRAANNPEDSTQKAQGIQFAQEIKKAKDSAGEKRK